MPDTNTSKSDKMKHALAEAVREHSAPNGFVGDFLTKEYGAPAPRWQSEWIEFNFDVDGVKHTASRRKSSRGDVAWSVRKLEE